MNGNEKGLSLIEVLVSLVILVIGLIGVFNLHIISKQGSFEAYQQTQASFLANDIINKMKLNPQEFADYAGTYPTAEPDEMNSCNNLNAICSAADMRVADLAEWSRMLLGRSEMDGENAVGGVESAQGCIFVNDNDVTVAIAWRSIKQIENRAEGGEYIADWDICGEMANSRKRLLVVNTVINGV
ncbi:type IV pilus modification protein PilV [Shewanella sp. OPT22]|nr:type IV pilus modification protein PilV [Shewanella sp. OPT22]